MARDIEPAEGYVAIKLIDDEDEPESKQPSNVPTPMDAENKAVMGICMAVGKKVTCCKKGDTVFCRPYARHGLRVDDNTVLVESYCVAGRVS